MKTYSLTVAAAAAASLLLLSEAQAQRVDGGGFAPDINNGSAYNNNAIIGLNPQSSIVRFANFRDERESVRNYVEVYSLTHKRVIGKFEVDVPPKASIQMNFLQITDAADLNMTDVAEQDLALYVQNGRAKQLYQHVQYNGDTRNLDNATVCTTAPHADYIAPHNVVMNAHSAAMHTTTSLISIHNFSDLNSTFQANIYDAVTGEAIGFVPITLDSREAFNESITWFEEQMNYTPERNQYHYNIELVPTSFPHGKAVIGHIVLNTRNGSASNLSSPCALHGGIITIDFPT